MFTISNQRMIHGFLTEGKGRKFRLDRRLGMGYTGTVKRHGAKKERKKGAEA